MFCCAATPLEPLEQHPLTDMRFPPWVNTKKSTDYGLDYDWLDFSFTTKEVATTFFNKHLDALKSLGMVFKSSETTFQLLFHSVVSKKIETCFIDYEEKEYQLSYVPRKTVNAALKIFRNEFGAARVHGILKEHKIEDKTTHLRR